MRNLLVYGEPSGIQNVIRYAKVTYPILDFHDPGVRERFISTTWESFYSVFGGMTARMPADFYVRPGWWRRLPQA